MEKTTRIPAIHLCTLFDSNFLAQGLTLINSVEQNSSGQIHWTILALDSTVSIELRKLSKANISVISFEDFDDKELRSLTGKRPWREICWTSAACLLYFCLNSEKDYDFVGYVDADCFFVADVFEMLSEIPDSKNFAIHEHKFSPDRIEWLPKSGRFNVGVVIGRSGTEFNTCVGVWREQVLLRCDVDMSNGRCGDQTYLNEWPTKYSSLHIFENPGIGLAPWNLNNYQIHSKDEAICIGLNKVYFFHFHGLEFRFLRGFAGIYVPAAGYQIKILPLKEIYKPYVSQLLATSTKLRLRSHQFRISQDFMWVLKNTLKRTLKIT
ncbi:hypothetical protein A1sIIA65_00200 [Candidatus Planktophila dulcis]|uniref:hypothetical protein n=1 Tax=Candidatus Planktophila dulcis TaxID=1884914 RepID=UPI000BAC6022|nr:hypothetical protein [Candidatus Planktophila dulcis]ASY20707.1 hypothetical protein A1sIIA65_00200 [Candidatus Planktophila dulcis]